jgi:hypothetical protein
LFLSFHLLLYVYQDRTASYFELPKLRPERTEQGKVHWPFGDVIAQLAAILGGTALDDSTTDAKLAGSLPDGHGLQQRPRRPFLSTRRACLILKNPSGFPRALLTNWHFVAL